MSKIFHILFCLACAIKLKNLSSQWLFPPHTSNQSIIETSLTYRLLTYSSATSGFVSQRTQYINTSIRYGYNSITNNNYNTSPQFHILDLNANFCENTGLLIKGWLLLRLTTTPKTKKVAFHHHVGLCLHSTHHAVRCFNQTLFEPFLARSPNYH